MAKKLFLAGFLLAVIGALITGLVIYSNQPKNAKEQLERADRIERENNTEIARQKTATVKDQAKIDALELATDDAYREVITKYPATPEAEAADLKLIERARARGSIKGRELISAYEKFIKDHPESEKNKELVFKIAKVYDEDLQLRGEAINKYREFVDKYPDDPRVPEAIFEIGKIQEAIKEFEAAEKTYTELIDKYPQHELAAEAQYRRANLRADELEKPEEAMKDFKDVEEKAPDSQRARVAQARREEIGQKETKKSQEKSQQEYYGTQEMGGASRPVDDWNDPTVQIIREQGLETTFYDIVAELEPSDKRVRAKVRMDLHNSSDTALKDTMIVQLNETVEITSLKQGDKSVTYEAKGNFLHVALNAPVEAGANVTFHFEYKGQTDDRWKGDVVSDRGGYLRPESRWYPYTYWGDEFLVDAEFQAPDGFTVVGPGLLQATETTSATLSGSARTSYKWKQDVPIGILACTIAKYEMKERTLPSGLLIQCYTYPEHRDFAPLYLDELEKIIPFYESHFGTFPYKKMAVAEIPFFPGGYGSPTVLMITDMVFKESNRVVAEFLAHEVAHQWFGNLVGLSLIDDSHPWLSEGFATYADALYLEHTKGGTAFGSRLRDMSNLYMESLLAFEDTPIMDALWDNPMYRTLAYEKSGLVLHMLRDVMGSTKFFEAMTKYVAKQAHTTVTLKDFQSAMEEVHGSSLAWFFDQWVRRAGFPHYEVTGATASKTATPINAPNEWTTSVEIKQLTEEPLFVGEIDLVLYGTDESTQTFRTRVEPKEAENAFDVTTTFLPIRVVLDPDNDILKFPAMEDLEKLVVAKDEPPAPTPAPDPSAAATPAAEDAATEDAVTTATQAP